MSILCWESSLGVNSVKSLSSQYLLNLHNCNCMPEKGVQSAIYPCQFLSKQEIKVYYPQGIESCVVLQSIKNTRNNILTGQVSYKARFHLGSGNILNENDRVTGPYFCTTNQSLLKCRVSHSSLCLASQRCSVQQTLFHLFLQYLHQSTSTNNSWNYNSGN